MTEMRRKRSSMLFRVLRGVLLLMIIAYAALLLGARAFYPRLLYPAPQADAYAPGEGKLLTLRAKDGVTVHATELSMPGDAPVIVYFHGNGVVMGNVLWMGRELVRRGLGVVLCEYRGYGLSSGPAPSEEGLYRDAGAVLDDLAARGVAPDRVALFGESLGTGVAAEMAAQGRGASLVLVTPYTSMPDMGEHVTSRLPILPVGLLMRERLATLEKAPRIAVPVLVLHGTDDEVVPYAMGQRIAAALPQARLLSVPGGHHNDLFLGSGARLFDEVARFVRTRARGEAR
jgi:pimeloyl-ACP methyl ester carboxylesterase